MLKKLKPFGFAANGGFGVGMMVVPLIGLSQYGKHRSVSDVFRARVESHLSNFNGRMTNLEPY